MGEGQTTRWRGSFIPRTCWSRRKIRGTDHCSLFLPPSQHGGSLLGRNYQGRLMNVKDCFLEVEIIAAIFFFPPEIGDDDTRYSRLSSKRISSSPSAPHYKSWLISGARVVSRALAAFWFMKTSLASRYSIIPGDRWCYSTATSRRGVGKYEGVPVLRLYSRFSTSLNQNFLLFFLFFFFFYRCRRPLPECARHEWTHWKIASKNFVCVCFYPWDFFFFFDKFILGDG